MMISNPNLTELNKLEEYLKKNKIPYQRRDSDNRFAMEFGGAEELGKDLGFDFHQICVPTFDIERRKWDCICHKGSFGYEQGLLEIMGCIVEREYDVEGYLTAREVIERIENYDKERVAGKG